MLRGRPLSHDVGRGTFINALRRLDWELDLSSSFLMSPSLASFPEELLVRILALALPPHPTASDLFPPRNRTAPLLVSRQFLRIASPLFYHTLHLHSHNQATRVLDTLTLHPALANAVRRLVFSGIWHASASVLALCDRVCDIDICLDIGPCHRASEPGDPLDVDAEAFCSALEQRRAITHLTIRKDPAVYLTHSRPIYVLQRLAHAVRQWTNLVSPLRSDPIVAWL